MHSALSHMQSLSAYFWRCHTERIGLRSNHLQMLEQKQHLLLNFFKTLSDGQAGNGTRASRTLDWHLTN